MSDGLFSTARLDRLRQRARVVAALRGFLDDADFMEVDPPILVGSPGLEPHLDAMVVHTTEGPRFLHTSPEYALKKLLGSGADRVYSLGACFRDEPKSKTHSPQFTMLEWYTTGFDLFELMAQTEALVQAAWSALDRPQVMGIQGPLTLEDGFERMTVRESFKRYASIDPWLHSSPDSLRKAAAKSGLRVSSLDGSWDDLFFEIFLNEVEPNLGVERPTFLWGWPRSQAALARIDPEDQTRALRFELYAGGYELANAFDELTDSQEQRDRFEEELELRHRLGKPQYPIDEAFLTAIDAMKPTAGIALGVDRLIMLLTNADDIGEVLSW